FAPISQADCQDRIFLLGSSRANRHSQLLWLLSEPVSSARSGTIGPPPQPIPGPECIHGLLDLILQDVSPSFQEGQRPRLQTEDRFVAEEGQQIADDRFEDLDLAPR